MASKTDPYKEKNYDLSASLSERIEEVGEYIDAQKIAMLTTRRADGKLVARAMAVAARENKVDLLFHTNTQQHKVDEIKNDPNVNVSFYKDTSGEWLSVSGQATLDTSRESVKKYYSPALKAWLGDLGDGINDGSENDPRIGLIRVRTSTITTAIQKVSGVTKAVTTLKGMFTGEAPTVNTIHELSEADIETARKL